MSDFVNENDHREKLTWEKVDQIRSLTRGKDPAPAVALAYYFGVAPSTIGRVIRGESWQGE